MLALCLVLRSAYYTSIMPDAKENYYARIMPGAEKCLLCWHYAWCLGVPIMLALCLVLRSNYYASIMPGAKECLLC